MIHRMKNLVVLTVTYAVTFAGGNAFAETETQANVQPKWSAANQYWDPAEMAKARRAVQDEHGASKTYFVQGDRLENQEV